LPFLQAQGERVFVMEVNPTAENIARLIYEQTASAGLPVIEVVLWETPSCNAAYSRWSSPGPLAEATEDS